MAKSMKFWCVAAVITPGAEPLVVVPKEAPTARAAYRRFVKWLCGLGLAPSHLYVIPPAGPTLEVRDPSSGRDVTGRSVYRLGRRWRLDPAKRRTA
jgi:hypothetical protein